MTQDRTPPHSLDAERSALGAVLIKPAALQELVEKLNPGDFFLPAHREVFEAMHALDRRAAPIDVLSLTEELKARAALPRLEGGERYLVQLADGVPTAENVGHYVAIVRDRAILRRLIRTCAEMQSRAYGDVGDVGDFMREAAAAVASVGDRDGEAGTVRVGEILERVISAMNDRAEKRDELGVPTGLRAFDRMIGPLRPGRLHVIAARPGIGKSSLMRAVALHAAVKLRIPTLIFSLEVTADELVEQFISTVARVPSDAIDKGNPNQEEWGRIFSTREDLGDVPIWVDDRMVSSEQVGAIARRWRTQQQAPIVQVWVDYLGLLRSSGREQTREREVAGASWAMKRLAKDLKCPVGLVVQLSRKIEERGPDAEPKLSDLRESGAIEQDAHFVGFVHRQEPLQESGPATLIVSKNRRGKTGRVPLHWLAEYATFTDEVNERDPQEPEEPWRR